MSDAKLTPPLVYWAQSKKDVSLLVNLEDCVEPTIKLTKDHLYFRGSGGTDKKEHELDVELFDEINIEQSKYHIVGRGVEFHLIKENQEAPYWKRLLKDGRKCHWLKIDFGKWKDESDDDDDELKQGGDFQTLMSQMSGGVGGAGEDMSFDGLDAGNFDDKDESDDDDLPDLEG